MKLKLKKTPENENEATLPQRLVRKGGKVREWM